MTIIAFLIGLALPALNGWLLLSLLQWKRRVLYKTEQWVMGLATGLLFTMLCTFIAHAFFGLPLSRTVFFAVQSGLLGILGFLWFLFAKGTPAPSHTAEPPSPRWARILLWILLSWIIIKALAAGMTFLVLTPTMLDDTLDNWNLRAKVFYFDESLTLALPSEDPVASPLGVSSYPPSLPLMKTWLAHVAGEWNEPLINSIHLVWYIAALCLAYCAMRRIAGRTWGLFAAYLLGSMPLYLMHGTNPYADAFMSVFVFSAASLLFFALRENDPAARMSFFRLGAFAAGLLPFTKNEGIMIYLPPLLLILLVGLFLQWKKQQMTIGAAVKVVAWYAACLAVTGLPWLIFKWMNGLTFGNAKAVGSLGIGWQEQAGTAIIVNSFFEGNWLFLFALLIILLIWRHRRAFTQYAALSTYILMITLGQIFIYLFTSLSIEAILQTGLARGFVQLMPLFTLTAAVLIYDARDKLHPALADTTRFLYPRRRSDSVSPPLP